MVSGRNLEMLRQNRRPLLGRLPGASLFPLGLEHADGIHPVHWRIQPKGPHGSFQQSESPLCSPKYCIILIIGAPKQGPSYFWKAPYQGSMLEIVDRVRWAFATVVVFESEPLCNHEAF